MSKLMIREFDRIARITQSLPKFEMIDWTERFPQEDSRTIAIRQSTYCCCKAPDCRKSKQIGVMTCKG